jgi:hypothetical protein
MYASVYNLLPAVMEAVFEGLTSSVPIMLAV